MPNEALSNRRLQSSPCRQAELQSAEFQNWAIRMHEAPMHMHRKVWEWCYAAQALYERGLLRLGARGLGFAVGQEPLPALFASYGCQIQATDVATEEAEKAGWVSTAQHACSLESLNGRGICDPEMFRERVEFRFIDMRELPDDLGTYDFIWSSCALEHLGTMALAETFVHECLTFLRPGGVAVHTTEFNLFSNTETITDGPTILFRRRDIESMAASLLKRGYRIDVEFGEGDLPADQVIDEPPYTHGTHLRVRMDGYVATSYGLIIEA